MKHLLKGVALLFSIAFCSSSFADDNIQFSGFGTVGVVVSDSETHGYRRDVRVNDGVFSGDVDFKNNSLLGLQLNSQLSNKVDFSGQVVLRDLPKSSFDRYLTQAFMRYKVTPNWVFRAGRMAPDLFLMTEYRDIDFSYPWATSPSEVYGIVPNRHFDGADLTYSTKVNKGTLSTKLFIGKSKGDVSTTETIEKIELSNIHGLSITYDNFDWSVQAKLSQAKIGNEIEGTQLVAQQLLQLPDFIWPNASAFISNLSFNGEKLLYGSVNGQYNFDNWSLSAEAVQISSDSFVIPKIRSAYIGAAYQLGNSQLFGIYALTNADNYSFQEPNVVVEPIAELINALEEVLNFYAANQRSYSLGWRYDLTSSLAGTIQWNYTKVDSNGSTLWWTPQSDSSEESINSLMFNLSFVF